MTLQEFIDFVSATDQDRSAQFYCSLSIVPGDEVKNLKILPGSEDNIVVLENTEWST